MKRNNRNSIIRIPAILMAGMFVLLSMFSSCENDLDHVKKVTATDQTPDQITNNLHSIYSDSGIVQYEILATRVEIFEKPTQKTMFKNGFEVNYFSKQGEIISKLQADYGEIIGNDNIIARNNVIFTNYEKNQTLKTEELFWDKKLKKIRTTKNFFVDSPTTEAKGIGLEADETFSNYSMTNFSLIYKDTTDGFNENE